jgi:hypothetical protein
MRTDFEMIKMTNHLKNLLAGIGFDVVHHRRKCCKGGNEKKGSIYKG